MEPVKNITIQIMRDSKPLAQFCFFPQLSGHDEENFVTLCKAATDEILSKPYSYWVELSPLKSEAMTTALNQYDQSELTDIATALQCTASTCNSVAEHEFASASRTAAIEQFLTKDLAGRTRMLAKKILADYETLRSGGVSKSEIKKPEEKQHLHTVSDLDIMIEALCKDADAYEKQAKNEADPTSVSNYMRLSFERMVIAHRLVYIKMQEFRYATENNCETRTLILTPQKN